jgi:F0F1-type ATP synthase membrane subunit b/b'
MAQILNDVAGLIVNGLPTFILVLLLTACVKYLYLQPLDKVLAERYKLTEGARKAAEESLRNADSRISEYETALAQARSGIYQEQSEFLRQVQNEQAAQVAAARAAADARIAEAKAAIAQEAKTAREGLAAQSDALATQIADSILTGRVS